MNFGKEQSRSLQLTQTVQPADLKRNDFEGRYLGIELHRASRGVEWFVQYRTGGAGFQPAGSAQSRKDFWRLEYRHHNGNRRHSGNRYGDLEQARL
jgi:hypothetical protein